ncbi:PLP-dependent aspartate aminotransferase family protein [Balneolales bacterium ANBcel1]|nr:PLP-dependent aspartate aminotransferase family protein [Balneolales bacterium ANBcel1]
MSKQEKQKQAGWHPETRAIHAGWHPERPGDPAVPGWEPATIFRHPEAGLSADSWSYTRLGNPNREQLEQTLASIEGGRHAVSFASGMAAVQAVFHLLSPGDHVLLPEDLYHGVRNLIRDQYARWGLSFDFVDMASVDAVKNAATDRTKLLWMETPSNPMLRICDIAALCRMARSQGWLTVVDNTWTTPAIQRPLELGADISLYSTTKYIGGHSDALGGALVLGRADADNGTSTDTVTASADSGKAPETSAEESDRQEQQQDLSSGFSVSELEARFRTWQAQAGAVPSPFDCWMLTRSLKTLYARIRTQSANAQIVAGRLLAHHAVERVFYPGLKDHPGREIASRQMDLPGAMISFQVKGDAEAALGVVNASQVVIAATSLGSVESTWEHRKTSEHAESRTPGNLIRLSVGIEHPEDIWKDVDQSLKALF